MFCEDDIDLLESDQEGRHRDTWQLLISSFSLWKRGIPDCLLIVFLNLQKERRVPPVTCLLAMAVMPLKFTITNVSDYEGEPSV